MSTTRYALESAIMRALRLPARVPKAVLSGSGAGRSRRAPEEIRRATSEWWPRSTARSWTREE
eukprot:1740318-Heterocapsa_arctica.AAC.1